MDRTFNFVGGFFAVLFGWLFGGVIAAPVFLMFAAFFSIVAALLGLPAIVFYYFIRTMIGA